MATFAEGDSRGEMWAGGNRGRGVQGGLAGMQYGPRVRSITRCKESWPGKSRTRERENVVIRGRRSGGGGVGVEGAVMGAGSTNPGGHHRAGRRDGGEGTWTGAMTEEMLTLRERVRDGPVMEQVIE